MLLLLCTQVLSPPRWLKNGVIQILVNFLQNTEYGCAKNATGDRKIVARIHATGPERIKMEVADNGAGIPAET